jgi:hypothetical protein
MAQKLPPQFAEEPIIWYYNFVGAISDRLRVMRSADAVVPVKVKIHAY